MRNIVFIGNSLANVKAIEEIRKNDNESNIVLVTTEACYPYGRDRALSFLAREIKEKQVFEQPETFYRDHQVRVITGQAVTRFNFKRCQVFLENKEQLTYDILILADIATPRLPDIKGHHKSGVYQAVRLSDIKSIGDQIPFADTIVVQVSSLVGFLTACALLRHTQNIVVCTSSDLLPGVIDQQSSDMLRQLMEASGVRLMLDNPIEEILGDSDAKAVRFRSGKVLASEMVILDDVRLDMRPLQETGLGFTDLERPLSRLKSNFPNVYWVDAVLNAFAVNACQHYTELRPVLENQGIALAREISGDAAQDEAVLTWTKFQIRNLNGFWVGNARIVPGGCEFSSFDAESNVYKKIFTQNGVVTGAVVFNAECFFSQVVQLIGEKINIQGIEDKVLQEGFDLQALKNASVGG